ncbi:MFS transporter [Saxibacter everestensis]|uniref:MFS transporter n=1 Tax=Saxibacter everestensis TaxID=2909229 RepID=A0ABY8QSX3_9MICO|nr:MFS transporter [Brevibacteriaceae bacterium ZFBP1038]
MATSPAARNRPRGGLTALCVGQLSSWGLLYYSLPVAVHPITEDTGWSATWVTGAFSLGLIISAVAGIYVGRLLDHRGPRITMTVGTLLGAAGLVLVGLAPNLPMFFVAWIVAGFAQSAALYPPAFAIITRWYGPARVRPLTIMTLVGGLASTVYAPITAFLLDAFDWRTTYFILATALAVINTPLHYFFLNSRWEATGETHKARRTPTTEIRTITRSSRFIVLQIVMATTVLALFSVTINIIPLLIERGIDYRMAALALGLIGAGQVAGRVVFSVIPHGDSPKTRTYVIVIGAAAGLWAIALIPGPGWLLIAAAVLTGSIRGCHTLLQATAVADRWGTNSFGTINGIFMAPITAVGALAPVAGPLLASQLGNYGLMAVCMAALTSLVAVLAVKS